jgi:hypothetical protein
MADNVPITAGSGTNVATDDISGVHYQRVKLVDGTLDGTGAIGGDATNGLDVDPTRLPAPFGAAGATSIAKTEDVASADADVGIPAMAIRKSAPGNTSGTDGDYEMLQMNAGALWVAPLDFFVTVSTDVTRPADTTAYTVNDALSDSTSAPTSGGFTFTSAARKSGGSGIITDAIITTAADAATLLQGEIWLFNTSVTNVNDNTAFAVSDAEIKTCVGKIPFTLEDAGNNGFAHVQNLNIGFTCSGSANLRFLIRVKNAYTPVSAEVFTFVLKIMQID